MQPHVVSPLRYPAVLVAPVMSGSVSDSFVGWLQGLPVWIPLVLAVRWSVLWD